MKKIRFSAAWYETSPHGGSYARFEAGKDYPADDDEAIRCIARGIAEEVDVPEPDKDSAAPSEAAPAPATGKSKRG